MYLISGLGVTVGFHRLFTHKSFETIRPLKVLFAIMGSMSLQGSLLKWVAVHRRHHQHSDKPDDPHSPHGSGDGVWGVLTGFWQAHVGWLFLAHPPELDRYVRDISADRSLRVVSNLFGVWVLLGLLIPTVLGGLLTRYVDGALLGFIWGGLVRMFLVHHVTWSINSVCHLWGTRPYPARDQSRNNFIFGVLALGEGWHNNHHAFPTSARHGLRWWQIDLSYMVIRTLSILGLAWRVRVPSAETVIQARGGGLLRAQQGAVRLTLLPRADATYTARVNWDAFLDQFAEWLNVRGLLNPSARWVIGAFWRARFDIIAARARRIERASRFRTGLHAAHLHHGLRGGDADADEAFVGEVAGRLGVTVHRERVEHSSAGGPARRIDRGDRADSGATTSSNGWH